MTTITRAEHDKLLSELALRLPVIVDRERIEVWLGGAMIEAGITVRDPGPAPPAVVRISRERYEAGVARLAGVFARRGWYGPAGVVRGTLDACLADAGIEVEPERTPEERLAEMEGRVAAFVSAVKSQGGPVGDRPSTWCRLIREHLDPAFPDYR